MRSHFLPPSHTSLSSLSLRRRPSVLCGKAPSHVGPLLEDSPLTLPFLLLSPFAPFLPLLHAPSALFPSRTLPPSSTPRSTSSSRSSAGRSRTSSRRRSATPGSSRPTARATRRSRSTLRRSTRASRSERGRRGPRGSRGSGGEKRWEEGGCVVLALSARNSFSSHESLAVLRGAVRARRRSRLAARASRAAAEKGGFLFLLVRLCEHLEGRLAPFVRTVWQELCSECAHAGSRSDRSSRVLTSPGSAGQSEPPDGKPSASSRKLGGALRSAHWLARPSLCCYGL